MSMLISITKEGRRGKPKGMDTTKDYLEFENRTHLKVMQIPFMISKKTYHISINLDLYIMNFCYI